MRYLASAFGVLLLASCAAPQPHRQALYSPLLSPSDIREITALADQRRDVRKPVYQITEDEDRRDRFVVYAGEWSKAGDQADYFTVQKRHGRWRAVSPVRHDTLKQDNIITLVHDVPKA